MSYCQNCGHQTGEGAAFCGNCGRALAADPPTRTASPAEPAAQPVLPPPANTATAPTTSAPDFAKLASQVLTGNWVGAFVTAASALGTALVLGLVSSFLLLSDRGHIGSGIWGGLEFGLTGLGTPLDLKTNGQSFGQNQVPLTVTLIAFLVAAAVFTRVTSGYPNRAVALADAARAAVLLGAMTTVLAIVLHIVGPDLSSYGDRGPAYGNVFWLVGLADQKVRVVPDVAGSIFIPAGLLFVVLVVRVLRQPVAGQSRILDYVRTRSLAAIEGLRALVWLTIPAGVVPVLATATATDADNSFRHWVEHLVALPNTGIIALGAGVGAPVGSRGSGFPDEVHQLGGLVDQTNWVMWLTIPVALITVGLAAAAVVRASDASDALWSAGVYVAGTLALLPMLGVFANIYLSQSGSHGARFGVDVTELTFTLWGASILALAVQLVVTGRLSLSHLQSSPAGTDQSAQH